MIPVTPNPLTAKQGWEAVLWGNLILRDTLVVRIRGCLADEEFTHLDV